MVQPINPQQIYPNPNGGANAVAINIFNPQAYGSAPSAATVPYQYTNSLYNIPQASMYQPQALPQTYQQYMFPPQQAPLTAVPAPQMMPQSVLENTQPQPTPQNVQQPVQNQETPTETINTDELVKNLADTDPDKRAQTINTIAQYVQDTPDKALQVVSEPVMKGLIDIIKEDTTSLEGPTEQQIAIAEKINKGEQLTPEEDALAEQLSPRDKANKNRIFALFALSMIQKLQREEINQYIETQKANGETPVLPTEVHELLGYKEMMDIINNDPRPEVKVAAIQALAYVTTPEDIQKQNAMKNDPNDKEKLQKETGLTTTIQDTLINASNSEDETVKQEALNALAQLGINVQEPAQAQPADDSANKNDAKKKK